MHFSRLWLTVYTVAVVIAVRLWRYRQMLMHVFVWHPRLLDGPKKKERPERQREKEFYGDLDMRRKAQLVSGTACDYGDNLVLVPNKQFDLNETIFSNLQGMVPRYIMKKKLAVKTHWSDAFIEEVQTRMGALPAVVPPNTALLDFMNQECDFSCEHADGSFWDHLRFCYDYSAIHLPKHSPRVMLLHSILGVGTNLFPCAKEKIPVLAELVTPRELSHISAFPSILRLVLNGSLIAQLRQCERPLSELKELKYYRVIDNQLLSLRGDEIWVHLNYQLMHLMDFLPAMDWEHTLDDPQLQVFIEWLHFLQEHGAMLAEVDMDLVQNVERVTDYRYVVMKIKERVFQRAVSKYSADIAHSLAFELVF